MKKVQKTVSIIALAILSAGVISCGDKNSSTLQEITSSFKSDVEFSGVVTYEGNNPDVGAKVILTSHNIDEDMWDFTVIEKNLSYYASLEPDGKEIKRFLEILRKRNFNVNNLDEFYKIDYFERLDLPIQFDHEWEALISKIESSSSTNVAIVNTDGNFSIKVKPGRYNLIVVSNNHCRGCGPTDNLYLERLEIGENGLQKLIKF